MLLDLRTALRPARRCAAALLTAVLLATALAPAASAQTEYRSRVDTTIAFGRNGWVDLGLVSGEIFVTGWTRSDARISASVEDGQLELLLSPTRIGIDARSRRGSRGRVGEARYELSVPVGTRVMVSATSGDVRVRGTGAEVQVTTVSGTIEIIDAADRIEAGSMSGDIHVLRARGRTRITTTSGDLELEEITGVLQVKAVSSDISLRDVESSDVRVGTTSGDITYGGTVDPKGIYEFTTHSGDVQLEIPSGTGARLLLQTYNGDISSSFPITLQPGENIRRQRGKRMEFTIGNGGANISVSTFSGDITIERGSSRPRRDE